MLCTCEEALLHCRRVSNTLARCWKRGRAAPWIDSFKDAWCLNRSSWRSKIGTGAARQQRPGILRSYLGGSLGDCQSPRDSESAHGGHCIWYSICKLPISDHMPSQPIHQLNQEIHIQEMTMWTGCELPSSWRLPKYFKFLYTSSWYDIIWYRTHAMWRHWEWFTKYSHTLYIFHLTLRKRLRSCSRRGIIPVDDLTDVSYGPSGITAASRKFPLGSWHDRWSLQLTTSSHPMESTWNL